MKDKTIELRGNHILLLYSKYQNFLDKKNGKGVSYEASKYIDNLSADKYGVEFTIHSKNLYSHLFNHPGQKVKIINGDDILCGRCLLREKKCENNPSFDRKIAKGFGMETNEDYTMEEIIKKLENEGKEFYEKNSDLFTLNALISLSRTIN